MRQQTVATAMWKETWIHVRTKTEEHRTELEKSRLEVTTMLSFGAPFFFPKRVSLSSLHTISQGSYVSANPTFLTLTLTLMCTSLQAEVEISKWKGKLEQSETAASRLQIQLDELRSPAREAKLEKSYIRSLTIAANKLDRFVVRCQRDCLRALIEVWCTQEGVQALRYARMQEEWKNGQGR